MGIRGNFTVLRGTKVHAIACALFCVAAVGCGPRESSTTATHDVSTDPVLVTRSASIAFPSEIRVSVFPHIAKYTVPQREEKKITEVSISSPSGCRATPVATVSSKDPAPANDLAPAIEGRTLKFTLATLTAPMKVECIGAGKIIREPALKSYRYAGKFTVEPERLPDGRAFIRVINHVAIDTYLKGVVPSEMPSHWAAAALRAQAIAARTYALWEVFESRKQHPEQHFDMDDTVMYQAYLGLDNTSPHTNQAVDDTQGQVMVYGKEVIKAYFHADSGGHTDDAENVWGLAYPYVVGKPEAFDAALDPNNGWTSEIGLEQLNLDLAEAALIDGARAVPVTAIEITDADRNRSGRVQWVNLIFADGTKSKIPGTDFSYAMRLRSTMFSAVTSLQQPRALNFQPDGLAFFSDATRITLSGRGYGHGVGMSQVGARILATSLNWDEGKILLHYYTGIDITSYGRRKPVINKQLPMALVMGGATLDSLAAPTPAEMPEPLQSSVQPEIYPAMQNQDFQF